MESNTLLPIVFGPFAAALLGVLFANVGISRNTKVIEYYAKRATVIEQVLKLVAHDPLSEDTRHLSSACQQDLVDILTYLRLTTVRAEEQVQIDYDKQRWYRQLRPPHVGTVSNRLALGVYYLYAFSTVMYVALAIVLLFQPSRRRPDDWFLVMGFLLSAVVAVIGHILAVKSARSAAIVARARRLLAVYDASGSGLQRPEGRS